MTTYHFLDDYSEGCHPEILELLGTSNMTQQTAYGNDEYSVKRRAALLPNAVDVPTYRSIWLVEAHSRT